MVHGDVHSAMSTRNQSHVRRLHLLPGVLLGLLLVAVFSPLFVLNRTLLPIAPSCGVVCPAPFGYSGPFADGTTSADPAGSLLAGFAFDTYAAHCMTAGTIPFWNPYQGLGQPFLANSLSAVLYPLNWLNTMAPATWRDLVCLLNLWLAAFFVYLYLAVCGLPRPFAIFGGVTLLAGGYFQIYLTLREVPAVAAWWPFLLYCVERAFREPGWRFRHLSLALGVYCTITGGQPEVAFLSLSTSALYALWRWAGEKSRLPDFLKRLVPGTAAGLLIAAPHWLPFVDYARHAFALRFEDHPTGIVHIPLHSLGTFFLPYLYGRLHHDPFQLGTLAGADVLPLHSLWSWGLSPGWLPAIAIFAALPSTGRTPRAQFRSASWFWVVVAVVAAKIWGLPGVNSLGALPVLRDLIIPRYAGFALSIALAILSAVGLRSLCSLPAVRWKRWVLGWVTLTTGIVCISLPRIVHGIDTAASEEARMTFVVFGCVGLVWCWLGPLCLWWLRSRCPQNDSVLVRCACWGVLLQAVAFAPSGYTVTTYGVLLVSVMAIFVSSAIVTVALRRREVGNAPACCAGWLLLAGLSTLAAYSSANGLALRYDPWTPTLSLDRLRQLQQGDLYRSYALDGVPMPNSGLSLQLSSLGILEPLLPAESAEFMRRFLDSASYPSWFAGNASFARTRGSPAEAEFVKHRRFFNLASVRFLVSRRNDTFDPGGKGTDEGGGDDSPIEDLRLISHEPGAGLYIWENLQAVPRVFFAGKLGAVQSAQEAFDRISETDDLANEVWAQGLAVDQTVFQQSRARGELLSFRLEPNDVWIEYLASSPGILVLSDSYAPGWSATLNDVMAPVYAIDGVFRGVAIQQPGRYRVHFRYRPPLWELALALAGAGLIVLVLSTRLSAPHPGCR